MSKLSIYDTKGKEIGKLTLDESLSRKVNSKVLYQAVNNYLASRHRGTHKAKKRREVRGGGKKPWRQKGTGRARSGSIRNPLWTGGGVIFGPVVRSYSYTIPRKVKRIALVEAIKSKIQKDNCILFDSISIDKPKTKEMTSIIKKLGIEKGCLMVVENVEDNVKMASRNIRDFSIRCRKNINAMDVLEHDKLAISEEAFKNLTGKT
ncbi:MAG: 50S ribosomal protein L4 [Candidatus Omnitrophica bacterium]|nr:50S ribosomal protein L4 [Candidatus Omnitrophota bacterium]